jgi:hypothetical protein
MQKKVKFENKNSSEKKLREFRKIRNKKNNEKKKSGESLGGSLFRKSTIHNGRGANSLVAGLTSILRGCVH